MEAELVHVWRRIVRLAGTFQHVLPATFCSQKLEADFFLEPSWNLLRGLCVGWVALRLQFCCFNARPSAEDNSKVYLPTYNKVASSTA